MNKLFDYLENKSLELNKEMKKVYTQNKGLKVQTFSPLERTRGQDRCGDKTAPLASLALSLFVSHLTHCRLSCSPQLYARPVSF